MWIATLINAIRTTLRYRKTVAALSMLNDRSLEDIGVPRHQIRQHARKAAKAG